MAHIESWTVEGFWQNGEWHDEGDEDFDDINIGDLDAVVVHVELSNDADMYLTIHGADDLDDLDDLVETAVDGYEEGGS